MRYKFARFHYKDLRNLKHQHQNWYFLQADTKWGGGFAVLISDNKVVMLISPFHSYRDTHIYIHLPMVSGLCLDYKVIPGHTNRYGAGCMTTESLNQRFSNSQNVSCWKGPLEVIWSSPPAGGGSPRVPSIGLHSGRFWTSPGKETLQPLWKCQTIGTGCSK